jgi:hypothetical protein
VSDENYHTYQHLPLADRATYRTNLYSLPGERGYIPPRGAPCQYLAGEGVRLACASLRGKLSCVHRRVATRRCGEVDGLVSGCGENSRRSPPGKEPTSTAKLWIDLVHLSSDPKCSDILPHLYACAQPAFHTRFTRQTNSTPPPSVRARNLRTQECSHHKGSLRFDLANIMPLHLDACVCVRAWFKSREVQKRQ